MKRLITLLLVVNLFIPQAQAGITFDKVDDSLSCGTGLVNLGPVTYFVSVLATDAGENSRGRFFNRDSGSENFDNSLGADRVAFARCFQVGCASEVDRITSTTTTYAVKHNYIITWDGGTSHTGVHHYFDGTEASYDATGDLDGTGTLTDDTGTTIIIGNNAADGTRTFNGQINEAAQWDAVLSAASIAQLQSELKGIARQIEPANLKAYWAFDEKATGSDAEGVTQYDPVGGNNCTGDDGTVNGTGLTYNAETYLNRMPSMVSP